MSVVVEKVGCTKYSPTQREMFFASKTTTVVAVVIVVVVVLTLTRIIKSVVTGQAPVTLELRNTPEGKTQTTQGGTRIYHS